jgi:hypothetical protein
MTDKSVQTRMKLLNEHSEREAGNLRGDTALCSRSIKLSLFGRVNGAETNTHNLAVSSCVSFSRIGVDKFRCLIFHLAT